MSERLMKENVMKGLLLAACAPSCPTMWGCGSSGGGDNPLAATPTFSPVAGTYATAQTVTIASATAGAAIYYTVDGTNPTTASTAYTAPVSIAVTTTLKAIATATGYTASAVATGCCIAPGAKPSTLAFLAPVPFYVLVVRGRIELPT
jgi:hypothetical protein